MSSEEGRQGWFPLILWAAVKAKVALIEKHKMGGDCLNTGCVPSKALIRSAKILSYIKRHKDYGIKSAEATFDFAEVMERVQNVIKKVEPHDSVERYSSLGVDCFTGEAKILSPHEVSVNGKTLTTKNIIIATGARPAVPNIPGLDKVPYLTSDNIWDIRELPKRLVVAGGGPIGSELVQCFARLGSKVTQVQRGPEIMKKEDDEIAQAIRKRFTEEGVDVSVNSTFKEVVVENGKQYVIIEKNGNIERIEFDKLLIAIGRAANTKGFGLEEIGVKLTKQGTIEVDEYLRTNDAQKYLCLWRCGRALSIHPHGGPPGLVLRGQRPFQSFKKIQGRLQRHPLVHVHRSGSRPGGPQ